MSYSSELARLRDDAETILRLARENVEAKKREYDQARAELVEAETAFASLTRSAQRVLRPRVLLAGEGPRQT